ncbi:MAG: flagellar basal-body rod protein FlgF [Alphaproteobacteria bacterium]
MESPIYIATSLQTALRRQMDVVANNVANMNTPGFKRENMVFMQYMPDSIAKQPKAENRYSMVMDYGNWRNTAQGPLLPTGNPLDVSIQGKGFFTVQDDKGNSFYTRSGNFSVNANGELVDKNGYKVMGDGGSLTIPPNTNVVINDDGRVTAGGSEVGKLKLAEFDKEQFMTPLEGGLYKTDQSPQPPKDSKIVQAMLEESNVQPVVEMTKMIEIQRRYQSVQNMIDGEHERIRSAVSKLAKIS